MAPVDRFVVAASACLLWPVDVMAEVNATVLAETNVTGVTVDAGFQVVAELSGAVEGFNSTALALLGWALPTAASDVLGEVEAVARAAPNISDLAASLRGSAHTFAQASSSGGVLDRHNTYRARHGAQALRWDSALEGTASAYARRCNCNPLRHSGRHGENLGVGFASEEAAVDFWYNENSAYDYANPDMSNFHAWGHFSQVVWLGSQRLGCASARCDCGGWRSNFVCHYAPAGNVLGTFRQQVLPPQGSGGGGGGGSQGAGGCSVELYGDCDYGQHLATVRCTGLPCKADYTWLMQNTRWQNDAVSSVKVSPGCKAVLREHGDCGGRGVALQGNFDCLVRYSFNDVMSCLTLEKA